MLHSDVAGHEHARLEAPSASEELLAEYRAYRKRQARGLVSMLPREAIRPLYRRAVREGYVDAARRDPLATLVDYCETLLPLPPFELWCEDRAASPEAYLHDLDDSAEAPTAEAPTTVEARTFDFDGTPWTAYLRSYRDETAWRGFIAFEERATGRVHRTAPIFRESNPTEIRDRFLDFEPVALSAFLRSARP